MSSPLVFSGMGLTNPPHIYPHASGILVRNGEVNTKKRHALFFAEPIEETEESESSSIGDEDESSEEDEEIQSERKDGVFSFSSLETIEEALPIKRGLSNHFSGKSKSFASLADIGSGTATAADLAKPENPLNKRRRILLANKARRASYSSFFPTCDTVLEEGDEEDEEKIESPVAAI